ncbi:hypothetical protein LN996_02425 [Arthrobacter sp. AK01]|uniref:NACHT domain-containing protein n=1 Tax=Arthrobacter sp. AK01 TaxID=2894084 RepID=UPI001E2EA571|nr:hypothetical protein [Arthrobacter sp. AK01]MCD4849661.1 hypothetical protein [Arthrobacter sp. AK01]
MADDYPLENLSDRAFEQLTVALSLKVLGAGVQAFGAGKDGGREATYNGPVNWSATTDMGSDSWNGYVVIQAKQKVFSDADPMKNAAWLRGQIKDELDRWEHPDSKRGKIPEYLIFVTNVRLSSVPVSGGIDKLDKYISERTAKSLGEQGFKGWKIWHRDQINGLLTVHGSIRHAFPAMLTVGDVLERLGSLSARLPKIDELREVLVDHARTALAGERWVNFSEAGGESRDSVENVIIDLPAQMQEGAHGFALRTLLQQGEYVLRESMQDKHRPRHVVLTGAPGNGKSTLSKFLVQVYRAAFVELDPVLRSSHEIVEGTHSAQRRLRLETPKNKRWPVKVNLAEFADAIGPNGSTTLMRWISELVTKRSNFNIDPAMLGSWLRVWPWLLVLDGLDEVTSPEVRRRVLDEIDHFVERADAEGADLLVVVTTRPTGYTERVSPRNFVQLDLGYLESSKAVEYGTVVINRRLADDHERLDSALSQFNKAVLDPNAERLLKTPLQVLILTFILDRLGSLPADRYHLFWRYYETLYDREASKATSLRSLFAQHRDDITELHERVGILLQMQAETLGEAKSRMPMSVLRTLATERMIEVGHDAGTEAKKIAQRIVQAATHRLVLLVPGEEDTVSFEVRSLQELMAARAISSGSDDDVRHRLEVTAPSPHWRNTWVFVAGKLFTDGSDHQRDLLTSIVSAVDESTAFPSWLCPVAPELAADILDDGLAASKPKWQRRFVDISLKALQGWVPRDPRGLALGLTAAAENQPLRVHIRGALKTALAGAPKSLAVACITIGDSKIGGAAPMLPKSVSGYRAMWDGSPPENHTGVIGLGTLLAGGTRSELDPESAKLVDACLVELDRVRLYETTAMGLWPKLPEAIETFPATAAALKDEEASTAIELLCDQLEPNQWLAQALLARIMWPPLTRQPVGSRIQMSFRNPWIETLHR